MVSLITTTSHKRSTKVRIKGQTYAIDATGVVEVSDEHAAVLEGDRTWRPYKPGEAAATKDSRKVEFLAQSKAAREKLAAEKLAAAGSKDEPPAEGEKPGDVEDAPEWPDPDEALGLEKLREMADAYEVPYAPGTQPKTLVKLLNKAMFE